MRNKNLNQEELNLDVEENEISPKKRKKYVTQKGLELENLLHAAKEYKFSYKPIRVNFKNKEEVSSMTNGTCIRPDLYLNNDNSCVTCSLYENCACSLKNLGKKKRNERIE
jgi:urocanate hydratase